MTAVYNLLDGQRGEEIDRDGFRCFDLPLRPLLGSELFGCSLYEIPPGERLWPYHFHVGNEEWLVAVTGTPTLRTPDGERELVPGDIVAFPEGEAGAHTLVNRGEAGARVAIFSTLHKGSVGYPDSGKVAANRRCFRLADAVDYWEGE